MTQLLVFVLVGLVALMILGHLSTPRGERLPVRRWTPVYLMDRVPHAVRLFQDAGARSRSRFEDAAAERESTVKDQGRRVEDLPGRADPDGRADLDGPGGPDGGYDPRGPRGRA